MLKGKLPAMAAIGRRQRAGLYTRATPHYFLPRCWRTDVCSHLPLPYRPAPPTWVYCSCWVFCGLPLKFSTAECILGEDSMSARVIALLRKIDMGTILFFLGILMAVGCLAEIGVLTAMGRGLESISGGNHYLVTGIIGVLSSIVDNVPLVAGCMGMYPIAPTGDMAVDGIFWQLLAYCAGVGGSMLIIGSAAGVVVMGLEKITFGWYMKRITWVAFVGYLAGILTYWVERMLFFN